MNEPAYPGIDGFLGTRAPLVLDIVCLSMIGVVLVLAWSIYQVKVRHKYSLHKWTQVTLGIVLLIVIIVFEIDIRLHGWEARAAGKLDGRAAPHVFWALYVHLVFAVSTVVLWPVTIVLAMWNFSQPPMPGPHSRIHVPLARTAAGDMVLTAITGWIFYWLAFVR